MKIEFDWHDHNFEADVVWNGEDYEVEAVHMIVGEVRVDMVHFMGQFDEVNEFLIDAALKANDDDVADWNEP